MGLGWRKWGLAAAGCLMSTVSDAGTGLERGADLWVEGLRVTAPRTNIYGLDENSWRSSYSRGELHTQVYPVDVSGLFLPYDALNRVLESPEDNPLRQLALDIGGRLFAFKNFTELYQWLGLAPYSSSTDQSAYHLPRPAEVKEPHRAGAGIVSTELGPALSFSCLSCHANEFFGHTVVGLPNKRARANELFVLAKRVIPALPSGVFERVTQASASELAIFKRTQENLGSVRPIPPLSLGLDTSLAHVGLSLTTRREDGWGTASEWFERFPRSHQLDHLRSDSKPMPWWTLKHKNRWLSDGSVVSGNPILTNILWNEIGRGTNLRELDAWMEKNSAVTEELTVRVFATQAPKFLDFFPASALDINRAKRGQGLFQEHCSKCHGVYEKAWDNPQNTGSDLKALVANARVIYFDQTPVIDVGTEANRYEGMVELSQQLNSLEISKRIGVRVVPQKGYVPPPLEGIFARYPYLHNASVPNLCALLEPVALRPKTFVQGPSLDKTQDYDVDCVGYPTGAKIPTHWLRDREAHVDTRRAGRRPLGHERMLLNAQGEQKLNSEQKKDLIEFLKTL